MFQIFVVIMLVAALWGGGYSIAFGLKERKVRGGIGLLMTGLAALPLLSLGAGALTILFSSIAATIGFFALMALLLSGTGLALNAMASARVDRAYDRTR